MRYEYIDASLTAAMSCDANPGRPGLAIDESRKIEPAGKLFSASLDETGVIGGGLVTAIAALTSSMRAAS
jgi:hypothetical protein